MDRGLSLPNEMKIIDIFEGLSVDKNSFSKIYYISDLHLRHHLKTLGSFIFYKNYRFRKIIENMFVNVKLDNGIVIIAGDITSDFELFKEFISEMSSFLAIHYYDAKVVVVLGNHEFMSFNKVQVSDIISEYKTFLNSEGIYLLHNNMLCFEGRTVREVKTENIIKLNKTIIDTNISKTSTLLFGGCGFSG